MLKKKKEANNVLNTILNFLPVCILPASLWQLKVPARIIPLNISEVGLFVIFILLLAKAFLRNKNFIQSQRKKYVLPFFLFAVSFVLGLVSLCPARETVAEAERLLTEQGVAVEKGIEMAKEVEEGSISAGEAKDQIQSEPIITEGNKEIAKKALETHTDDVEELKEELVPTIPLSYMKWNCNKHGCAFIDDTYVWQISWENRIMGTMVIFFSLGAMMWIGWGFERKSKK